MATFFFAWCYSSHYLRVRNLHQPLEQVKLCVEIGIDCMHDDPSKRPHIQDIIRRLNETDISVQVVSSAFSYIKYTCLLPQTSYN